MKELLGPPNSRHYLVTLIIPQILMAVVTKFVSSLVTWAYVAKPAKTRAIKKIFFMVLLYISLFFQCELRI